MSFLFYPQVISNNYPPKRALSIREVVLFWFGRGIIIFVKTGHRNLCKYNALTLLMRLGLQ